eukprot:Hpha_TRINITY_DN1439_c0_g1::TRINITY_DN1439_c0_g1_i1::g.9565::m.9565
MGGKAAAAGMLAEYERAFLVDDHALMLNLMSDEVKFSDPILGKEIASKAELRKYLGQSNGVMKNVTQTIEARSVDAASGNVALRWIHRGSNAVTGASYAFPGCTFITMGVTKEGSPQVTSHRDFFDPAILIGQFKAAYKLKKKQKQSKL